MLKVPRPRGATVNRSQTPLPHKHLLTVGLIGLCALLTYFLSKPAVETPALPTEPAVASAIKVIPPAQIPNQLPTSSVQVSTKPPPQAVATSEPPPEPWRDFRVKPGDNLSLIFKRAGFGDREVYRVVNETADGKTLVKIFPGQTVSFRNNSQGGLAALKYDLSPLETIMYRARGDDWASDRQLRKPELREAWASSEIDTSLFLAGTKAGLSTNLIMEMANIFGGVIDFVMDPRKGDRLHLLYEEQYLDNKKLSDGGIIAASFTNRGKTYNAFRYEDSTGRESYYSEDGVSMRKAFLLAPVDFSRVSSSFNLRRRHPIYKTIRPHKGIDYAAPRGTPVYAAGDGRVIKSGYTRANGNYIFIKHGEKYITHYLHLHKRKVGAGMRVTQGQIIGSVGATGAATGPHLHYEFLVNGVHRNPRTIHKQLPKAKSLPESEMARFRAAISTVSTQLATLQTTNTLALNSGTATAQSH